MSDIRTGLFRLDEGWSEVLDTVIQRDTGEVATFWSLDDWSLTEISDALHLLVQSHEHHEEYDRAAATLRLAAEFDSFRSGEDDGLCPGCYDDDCPECTDANVTRED